MWKAKIQTSPQFSSEEPEALFKGLYYRAYNTPAFGRFDIHPDGDRFLMLQYIDNTNFLDNDIQMVVNWQSELEDQEE